MFYVMQIRRSWYEIEEVLVWLKEKKAALEVLPLLNANACNFHPYVED